MSERHITEILDGAPFASLSERDLAEARAHATKCADCRRAFASARASSLLLGGRAGATVEPPPFFQTRVLAALRERRAAEDVWSFARLWKSAGALVASMAAGVALLAGLTFVAPAPQQSVEDDTQLTATASSFYPSDDSILSDDDGASAGKLSDNQVLTTIYDQQEDEAR